ncbi:MAG: hypothetical protein WEA09_06255 [Gemmatimonadota bacterium]
MEDGLLQLLFFAFIIVASMVDAATRNKKKKERMEQMEREEASEAGGEGGVAAPPRRTPDRRPQGAEASGEDTADSMLPDDLWSILTGQDPSTRRRSTSSGEGGASRGASGQEAGGPGREGAPDSPVPGWSRSDPDPLERPHIPMPVPSDRISKYGPPGGEGLTPQRQTGSPDDPEHGAEEVQSGASDDTRRSSRWMSGLEERETRDPAGSEGWSAGSERATSSERWSGGVAGRPEVVELSLEEPWAYMEDITAGEIGEGVGGLGTGLGDSGPAATPGGPARVQVRGRKGASPYTRLLTQGREEALREAIVLREVLGEPVGWRDGSDIPGLK